MQVIEQLIESHYKPLILSEKEKKGRNIIQYKYYIDCFDLIDILKGVKRFTEDLEERSKISNTRTLAYNLILDGWIDNIHLLPTHQTEFFDLMYLDFGVRNPHINNEDINDLITEYEYEQDLHLVPEEDYRAYIETVVSKSVDRFNLYGLARANNWQKRLQKLVDLKILHLKDYDLQEVVQLVTTNNFKKIKMATDQIRSKSVRNKSNFNDALALTYLAAIKNKEPNTIPVLLDSKGFYTKIIEKSGFQAKFEYDLQMDKSGTNRISIVRGTAYFVLKSIFDCPKEKLDVINRKFPKYYKILEENKVIKFIPANKIFSSDKMTNFFLEDPKLKKIYKKYRTEFKDYLENEFFNKVWLSCYEDSFFTTFIDEHYKYQKEDIINKTKVINAYKISFLNTYRKVKEESETLSVLTNIWANFSQADFSDKFDKIDDSFNVFLSFGAFRFSFPFHQKHTIDDVNEAITKLILEEGLSGNIINKNAAIHQIVKRLFDGLSGNSETQLNKLSMAVSILWSLGQYKSIDKIGNLFYKNKNYPHYSFALAHSAAMLKITTLQHNRKKVLGIINCIEQKVSANNYKYLIGKTYVFFFLWKAECKNHFSLTLKAPVDNNHNFVEAHYSMNKALSVLKEKNYIIDPWRLMLFLYALNLKIFMITEGGSEQEFQNLESIVDEFKLTEGNHPVFWQSRYDDTIARYYLRLALQYYSEKNIEGFEMYLHRAKTRIDKALRTSSEHPRSQENFQEKVFEVINRYAKGILDDYLA